MRMIKTDRLTLRPFSPDDWQDLYEYLSNEEVIRFEPYGVFTVEQCKQEAEKRSANPAFWAVCLRSNGKLIGNLYLEQQDFGVWELGYVFNSSYQRRGYATEAGQALLAWAFYEQDARRITAMCNPLNAPSWRLLERLGMRREGHLRQNVAFNRDETGQPIWQDTYLYAVLASEWNRA
ncbi:MAG: GNAT family N-acetyltransferase [Oscillospiraceae bacterium]|jgi:ribosomal-protein-alanine N-acetyltransferase